MATLAWGAGFTALPICLQSAVLRVAPDIPDTASALYVVAFQIGIGGGALAGAGLLGAHELSTIPDVALAVFLAGSLLAALARVTFAADGAHAAHPAVRSSARSRLTRLRAPGARLVAAPRPGTHRLPPCAPGAARRPAQRR